MKHNIEKAKIAIRDADAILVGASNGLSIAEGYHIFANNEMFHRQFGDFERKFGIRNVIEGCFYSYPDEATRNEFVARLNKLWVEEYVPSEVMKDLMAVIGDKDYFIVTSNADSHLEIAGFDHDKIFEIEGKFSDIVLHRRFEDKSSLLNAFLARYHGRNLVILELGIGSRNTLIKQPLMQLTASEPNATYITLNLPHEIYVPEQIAAKSIALPGDIAKTLKELSE